MPKAARLLPCALLTLAEACKPDCPQGATDRNGYNCTPVPGDTEDTSTSSGDDTSTTADDTSSTGDDTSTTTPDPCDDDPACGPGEDIETCPAQCGACGDGIVSGDEACDNGPDNQTYWPSPPPADACSDTCTTLLEWCGDATLNGPETCDNGTNTDPDYTFTPPPPGACASACLLPGHCGDATLNGPEPCDDAAQTPTCELTCLQPTCGDGFHNPQAGEACDDANTNDGDGCSADCKSIERLVFVSSLPFVGDLKPADANPDDLSGLALADARCQQLATAAALPGTYKAWLSTNAQSPSTRFDTRFTGLYRLTSEGAPIVAMGWQGLISGTLLHAIDADEAGLVVQKNVWTDTLPDGTKATDNDCSGWTVNDNSKTAFGQSSTTDATWTNADVTQCSNTLRLYCFQDA